MSNKEKVLEAYEQMTESRYPGKGKLAAEIIARGWDHEADEFVSPGRLAAMGYRLDENLAFNCVKGIAKRHPELAKEIAALR